MERWNEERLSGQFRELYQKAPADNGLETESGDPVTVADRIQEHRLEPQLEHPSGRLAKQLTTDALSLPLADNSNLLYVRAAFIARRGNGPSESDRLPARCGNDDTGAFASHGRRWRVIQVRRKFAADPRKIGGPAVALKLARSDFPPFVDNRRTRSICSCRIGHSYALSE